MVLVGAGGAGRGLAYGVKLLGGELLVADLDESEGGGHMRIPTPVHCDTGPSLQATVTHIARL